MNRSRKPWLIALAGLAALAVAFPALAGQSELSQIKRATARFHSVEQAEAAGYERFLGCFDSTEGGMGQHYVDTATIDDGVTDALRPEALVYQVDGPKLTLVAVEWVEVGAADDPPPVLFDEPFHYNSSLGVWALHGWIWKDNPQGVFADWNPNVASCPRAEAVPAWLP